MEVPELRFSVLVAVNAVQLNVLAQRVSVRGFNETVSVNAAVVIVCQFVSSSQLERFNVRPVLLKVSCIVIFPLGALIVIAIVITLVALVNV